MNNKGKKLRGVNLGGWLVLEKWMTPSLFTGLKAVDETTFCAELAADAEQILKRHWQTFITREDFLWLAGIGVNAVRIPVGHWIFGPGYPYHKSYGDSTYPFVEGGIDILDQAFDWAEESCLGIVLDLHAAPGCQNGFDNGGIKDVCEWHTKQEYIDFSLQVLENLAKRYHQRKALIGIEVLNEPRWDLDLNLLKKFTIDGYRRIRKYCPPESVAVVFHDAFRDHKEFDGFMSGDEFDHVIYDIHRYQCFIQPDLDMDIYGHIQKAAIHWKNEADAINRDLGLGTYVGEWSLGLNMHGLSLSAIGSETRNGQALDPFQTTVAYRAYAAAQLATFERYRGWFFWSYKTETSPAWCFRDCVDKGWLPKRFDGA